MLAPIPEHNYKAIQEKYAPVVFLHSQERIAPCNIYEHFTKAEICQANAGERKRIKNKYIPCVENYTEISNQTVLLQANTNKFPLPEDLQNNPNLFLNFPYNFLTPNDVDLSRIECYSYIIDGSHVKFRTENENKPIYDFFDILYYYIFPYNPAYKCGCMFVNQGHFADSEFVRIRINKITNSITEVFYSAHGSTQGQWIRGYDLEYADKDRQHPIVYLAKGSHGAYHKAKTYYRIFCFANDLTNCGYRWEPKIVNLNDPSHREMLKYKGKMSIDGGMPLSNKIYWAKYNPNIEKVDCCYRCWKLPIKRIIKKLRRK